MVKTIFKEIIIILLLCVAILLVLSILFYDYNPINKVIPNKIAYTPPENIKNELEEENIENAISIENKVYTIDGADLNIYKKSKSYNPSKENPFASTSSEVTNTASASNTTDTEKQNNTKENTSNTNDVKTNTSGNKNTGLK